MAYKHAANVIIVDTASTTIPGVLDIVGVEATGTATIKKGAETILEIKGASGAAVHEEVSIRSASGLVVDPGAGVVRLYLRLHT